MRKVLQIAVVLLSIALMATGCDFFRVLAGRPTSKEIEAKRAEILRSYQEGSPVNPGMTEGKPGMIEEKPGMTEEKPGMTEGKPGMTQEASLPAVTGNPKPAAAEQGEARKIEKKRYYVIMGAFSSKDNAVKYAERIKSFGYEPEFFGFTEGRTAVGAGGTDDPEEAKAFMRELKGQDFCPEGVWILDRKK
ncbi:MAG: SPOR domain-containing protein [Bacteroidales bacterium]|nr:SPOR domain-containing protein [Bacteroidales bacterium]